MHGVRAVPSGWRRTSHARVLTKGNRSKAQVAFEQDFPRCAARFLFRTLSPVASDEPDASPSPEDPAPPGTPTGLRINRTI